MEAAITGLFTILGVLTGVGLTAMLELSKEATNFRVAVRMLRSEIEKNKVFLETLVDHPEAASPTDVKDDAWLIGQRSLALLLPQRDWDWLTGHYAMLSMARHEFELKDRGGDMASPGFPEVIEGIPQMVREMRAYEEVLSEVGLRPRWRLVTDIARGRTVRPPKIW
jgi:hypothetical protein